MNNYYQTGSLDHMSKINEEAANLESPGAQTNDQFMQNMAAGLSPDQVFEDENNDKFNLSVKPMQNYYQTQRT